MEKYRRVAILDKVNVGQYWHNGDCGLESWADIGVTCEVCGRPDHEHGSVEIINGGIEHRMVCPGEWVVFGRYGKKAVMTAKEFEKVYERV